MPQFLAAYCPRAWHHQEEPGFIFLASPASAIFLTKEAPSQSISYAPVREADPLLSRPAEPTEEKGTQPFSQPPGPGSPTRPNSDLRHRSPGLARRSEAHEAGPGLSLPTTATAPAPSSEGNAHRAAAAPGSPCSRAPPAPPPPRRTVMTRARPGRAELRPAGSSGLRAVSGSEAEKVINIQFWVLTT